VSSHLREPHGWKYPRHVQAVASGFFSQPCRPYEQYLVSKMGNKSRRNKPQYKNENDSCEVYAAVSRRACDCGLRRRSGPSIGNSRGYIPLMWVVLCDRYQGSSWFCFLVLENGAVVKKVGIWVVPIDIENFRDKSALEMNDDVDGITDVCLDGAVREFHAALEDATRKPCQALLRRAGVNRG